MKIIRTVQEMHAFSDAARQAGKRIGFVPTMGYLHEGHLSLMRISKERADVLVVSIFVNPMQFGPSEDFKSYPRDWDRDSAMVASVGADCIFAPEVGQMYPDGYQTSVRVANITANLCGASRPVHFEGVATVVAKLFNCVKPHCAVFGEKDFQQLMVIRRMVQDLNLDIEIIGAPIIREAGGLAMSSRNKHLTPEERAEALCLSQSLCEVKSLFEAGERNAAALIERARKKISARQHGRIDYIKVCDVQTLVDVDHISRDAVMALAVNFGRARLIDNIALNMPV